MSASTTPLFGMTLFALLNAFVGIFFFSGLIGFVILVVQLVRGEETGGLLLLRAGVAIVLAGGGWLAFRWLNMIQDRRRALPSLSYREQFRPRTGPDSESVP